MTTEQMQAQPGEAVKELFPDRKVVVERVDDTRLLMRCRAIFGGCGASFELQHQRGFKTMPPQYLQFFRDHGVCTNE